MKKRRFLLICVILELICITGCHVNLTLVGPDSRETNTGPVPWVRMSPIVLFLIGAVELIISTVWTKSVSQGRFLASGLVTLVNVLLWCYVIQIFVQELNNAITVVSYAGGCAIGNMASAYYLKRTGG